MHNVRVLSSDLFGTNEDCSLGDSISDSSEKLLWGFEGDLWYIGVLQQRAGSQNIKLNLCLAIQGMQFETLVRELDHTRGAAKKKKKKITIN